MTTNLISDTLGSLGDFLISILVTLRDFILGLVPVELQNIVILAIAIGLASLLYWRFTRTTRVVVIATITIVLFIMLKAIGG